jgi:hypothetical protein
LYSSKWTNFSYEVRSKSLVNVELWIFRTFHNWRLQEGQMFFLNVSCTVIYFVPMPEGTGRGMRLWQRYCWRFKCFGTLGRV